MFFYVLVVLILLAFSTRSYGKFTSFFPHIIILGIIALKGEVGPDFTGYLNRYLSFDPIYSFQRSTGEFGWYLIEYFTYKNTWSYQMYTVLTGIIGVGFLMLAQRKIKYLGFLVFIFQLLIVQLGLSGMRQFIAACIIIYAVSIYVFEHQKSYYKFIVLIVFAASFHISALTMIFILPFVYKLKKYELVIIIIFGLAALSADLLNQSIEKYETRYIEGSRVSSGAWIRFAITFVITLFALNKNNKKLYYLGLTVITFGSIIGIINTIALHRFNYYLLPIACLILIKNYRDDLIPKNKMTFTYLLSVFYFLIWFSLSNYSDAYIPYKVFFES